ncbi:hypothetical protein D9619_004999 [Psilocybe cf. subviscida]|uniref:DUF6533 domain-containing protein n=1 Tax=Psilocybe cf. subviscida TaxID=2480587 RepID=A0A8H5F8H8_9AGAR|nr:hypothetical protein D9619_004999 [Psilocybe cf. subviscida]
MDAAALATSVVRTRVVSYVNGTPTLFFEVRGRFTNFMDLQAQAYDWLLTLDGEIKSIWLSRWNFTKFLYVLTRYSSFIECAVVAIQLIIPGDNYYGCALVFKLNVWLYVFGLGTGEAIMTLRTWAVWEKNKILTYFLFGFLFIIWSGGFVIAGIFNSTVRFEPNPRTPYIGCYATHTSPIIFISWVSLLAFDTFMFVLMAIPAIQTWRTGRGSRLINLVLRDGVMYYLYLFIVSLINILVALTFPASCHSLLP